MDRHRDHETAVVRRAVAADIPELVRLRALLFQTLGGDYFDPPTAGEGWKSDLAAVLKEYLTLQSALVLVVDGAEGLAACGIGSIEQRLPGPHLRNGRCGLVIGVVTDPAYRRRGYSRAIMRELLAWFRDQGAARVDLYASHEGEPLYRELGFLGHPDPAMYWRP
jgi:GNAT superfamily N-acetyltransferase